MSSATPTQENEGKLGLFDAVSIILGIIIGAGIYETPPDIFQFMGDPWNSLAIWAVCGVLALVGALCYAELATAYPRSGGDYVYISRAYGPLAGYLFGWAQLAVIQTGSIGLMAYVFADYAVRLHDFGDYAKVAYAAGAIVVMTLLNILGVVLGKVAQNLLTLAKIVGLGAIIVAGFAYADKDQVVVEGAVAEATAQQIVLETSAGAKTLTLNEKTRLYVSHEGTVKTEEKGKEKRRPVNFEDYLPVPAKEADNEPTKRSVKVVTRSAKPDEAILVDTYSSGYLQEVTPGVKLPPYFFLSLAFVFVFLTYGGWNDAAFVAAEVRNQSKNIPRALVIGTAGVMLIYLAVNYAYLNGLGFDRAQVSGAIAADVLSLLPWEHGERAMSILVMISALGAVNGLIFTSSRIYATLGKDYSLFAPLGQWNQGFGTPVWSLLIQMVIGLAMVVGVGTTEGQQFLTSVIEFVLGEGADPGWADRGGFRSLLRCTAPVFWIFFLMTGLGLFILRINDPDIPRPFRVPLYPILPLIFCATCGYMVYSGVNYAGRLGLVGGLLVVAGLPFFVFSRRRVSPGSAD